MIRFNIEGVGFLNMPRGGVSFKTESQWFRFCDIGLGRSTEFSVPADDHNREMLGWPEDPAMHGEAMRVTYDAQLYYDGGTVEGMLEVRSWEKGEFKCVFYFGASKALEAMMDKPLKDCKTTIGGIVWASTTPKVDAENATQDIEFIRYDDYFGVDVVKAQIQPSVRVRRFIEDVLNNLGASHNINISNDLYMVSPSLNGGQMDTVRFVQTSTTNTSVVQNYGTVKVVAVGLEWATKLFFGSYVGGGSVPSYAFYCGSDMGITFDPATPTGIFMVKWSRNLGQYDVLGGVATDGTGDYHTSRAGATQPLAGMTVQLKRGDMFFFADNKFSTYNPVRYGYDHLAVCTVGATLELTGKMSDGDTWMMRNNMPDMTIFEYLKSVALAMGKELTVTSVGRVPRVEIDDADYSSFSDILKLDRVTDIDGVSRCVGCWGEGTRFSRVRFDSEDYVTEPLSTFYEVDNLQLDEDEETVSKFSEGGVSTADSFAVLIIDRKEYDSYESTAKKWTLGWAAGHAAGKTLLQRITAPDFSGYSDLAVASTCLKVRCHMAVEDWLALKLSNTFAWRGGVYVWTDTSWSGGVASLTLQRITQAVALPSPTPPTPPPYDAEVEYLESSGTQYINTAIVQKSVDFELKMEFQWTGTTAGAFETFFGYLKGSNYPRCSFNKYGGKWMFGTNATRITSTAVNSNRHTIAIESNSLTMTETLTFDGNVIMTGALSYITTQENNDLPFFAFARNGNGTVGNGTFAKIYALNYQEFTDSTHSVVSQALDFTPVRVGSVGYMYDRVSDTLFGNDGTGDFVVGPDVP